MTGEVGAPTDKTGTAYRTTTRRKLLRSLGIGGIGFGAGATFASARSGDGIVSALRGNSSTAGGSTPSPSATPAPTTAIADSTSASPTAGEDPVVEEVTAVEAIRGQERHVRVSAIVANPNTAPLRRGLYATVHHEPYESTGNRLVDLPANSRHEYLLRVPHLGDVRSAILEAVDRGDHSIDVTVGPLPDRFGDR